ncbi:MAG: hypothetical protein K6G88_11170 [Lachnospiraceae bacterium]|nr:hypothetical protein [Lachnospiraceae bacterium]
MSEMNEVFDFGGMFGFDTDNVPTAKKPEKKKEANKTEKKEKKSSKTAKKEEEKFSLPVTVYCEWGEEIVIEGASDESITLSALSKKVTKFPCEVVHKNDFFVAVPKSSSIENLENVEGDVLIMGQLIKVSKGTLEDTIKELLAEYPELEEVKCYKSGKSYRLKHDTSATAAWNVKLPVGTKVGLLGTDYMVMDGDENTEYTLKEIATKYVEKCPWLKSLDLCWKVIDKGSDKYAIAYLVENKSTEKLIVKLPCDIRFIHDAGPLSGGLTSDMFGGKEYVETNEILKVVSKYFPGIYQEKNTNITYVAEVNTVCVVHMGRAKGCVLEVSTYAGKFKIDEDGLEYKRLIKKIPQGFLYDIINYFKSMMPNEAIVQIAYDKERDKYRIIYPEAKVMRARVEWDDTDMLLSLNKNEAVVCEIHSHNSMPAFFSLVDDYDEVSPLIYGVIGKLDCKYPSMAFRAGFNNKFEQLDVFDIFELEDFGNVFKNTSGALCTVLCSNKNHKLIFNTKQGAFYLIHGPFELRDGTIEWAHSSYLGENMMAIDFYNLYSEYFVPDNRECVSIIEVLKKDVSLNGKSKEDIISDYYEENYVLTSENHSNTYFV